MLNYDLPGTVDVLNGLQLCPHHYIEGLRSDGPAAKSGLLQAGDELLQVLHFKFPANFQFPGQSLSPVR